MIGFFGDLACQLSPPSLKVNLGQAVSVLNLEGPIIDPGKSDLSLPPKAGPRLYSTESMLNGFTRGNSSWIFSLANNHSLDFGVEGLAATFDSLTKFNIGFCGAGQTENEASRAVTIEVDGVGIDLISCADRGFGFATTDSAGFALEGNWVFQRINSAVSRRLVPIVLYHGGVEDFSLPSPFTKKLFEAWADAGAKLVVGTHSHVPQPITRYQNSILCYGLGNFLVNPLDWKGFGDETLSSQCLLFDPKSMDFSVHHLKVRSCEDEIVEVIQESFSPELVHRLDVASKIICDTERHQAVWQEMCFEVKSSWLSKHVIFSIITEFAPRMFQTIPWVGKFFRTPFAIDTLAWSTHREMLLELLNIKNNPSIDRRNKASSELWSVVKGKCN
jgi:hypothetical protein